MSSDNQYNPYMTYPYQGVANQQVPQQPAESDYKSQNTNTHFIMGVAAGAAVAYLLTNKKFQKSVASKGEQAWSAVRGEVEELKERLEDTQAELEYYRNLHKGE
ncbi:YtxH domain-containing protein [Vibrio sp. JC009]|uniref:YtxH domain-containing protein n=1 Tax=Vibrio sp. JC009 TaxID=2912314 RepID=UPI0023B1F0D3|nr:YtxH domain-containing protein [Vibrio sp. JC009]WED23908.1 YtxH domain-containing protein [Vibrio sp. JC009]